MLKTAVITTGGLGTRLLTYTKSNPKTMLPLYDKSDDRLHEPLLRPLIELIFEKLYDSGFRRFCFIVGEKTKKSIFSQLIPNSSYVELLKKRNVPEDRRFIRVLSRLTKKMNSCEIQWISQATPMGFGHALYSAKKFVGNDTFLLHAGDAYFPNYDFIPMFKKIHTSNKNTSATLLIQHKKNLKGYGIAQIKKTNQMNQVFNVEEKPKTPKSNFVILPLYIFNPEIFDALKETPKGYNNELQVTDAIKTLIQWEKQILSLNYGQKPWFDIGTPSNYFKSLEYSFKHSR
jgi:UTP--glucose-1-phosphate uridylyltransferase